MISKERLEELIEQEKQVWKIYKDTCQGVYQVPAGLFGVGFSSQVDETTPFNELFETKEQAEWYKEFGCIERTDYLDLPTWEEIQKCSLYTLYFNNKELYLYRVYFNREAEMITIEEQNEEYLECFTKIEELPLTKENYILACRKAKELFLGEKENESN